MNPVIRVERLSKRYRIGIAGGSAFRYRALRDTLGNAMSAPLRWLRPGRWGANPDGSSRPVDHIWALSDVSFEVDSGEVLGIIGRNGAGKSTLLKILSRITRPTQGYAELHGRVGSLLEVGTGFHPELSGRENIYLNGAILGMRRAEIARKFDAIVDFSGVAKFIDTPVKHYSSGMYVRLAFAVAAHLEPEILLVDEVLAVGDAAFQKRCLGKMQEVSKGGRTVLLVSHHMAMVLRLCERAIFLDGGRLVNDGPANGVVSSYLQLGLASAAVCEWPVREEAPSSNVVRLRRVRVVDRDLKAQETVDIREPIGIEITYDVLARGYPLVPLLAIFNEQGVHVFNALDTDRAWQEPRRPGRYVSTAWIPGNLLSEGLMSVSVLIRTLTTPQIKHLYVTDAVTFRVVDPIDGDSALGDYVQFSGWGGAVRPLLRWTTEYRA